MEYSHYTLSIIFQKKNFLQLCNEHYRVETLQRICQKLQKLFVLSETHLTFLYSIPQYSMNFQFLPLSQPLLIYFFIPIPLYCAILFLNFITSLRPINMDLSHKYNNSFFFILDQFPFYSSLLILPKKQTPLVEMVIIDLTPRQHTF